MIAEIVAIGTELTSGQKLDTNSQWLSLQLADLGIPVHYHTTVADDFAANLEVLRLATLRADVVLITGGLGPTLDDLTRQVLAELAGVELELHPPSLQFIEGFFRHRGREMPERNRTQALFPAGSVPLPNPVGTAPGIWMELERAGSSRSICRIAALPGVPSEMHRMFTEQVRPRLPGGANVIRRVRINCFGLGESHTEQLLGELTARGRDPEIGITAHEATITLRIVAQGRAERECLDKIEAARTEIRRRLGHYVFGEEDEEVEHALVRLLRERGATLATAESGTGGYLAHCLTAVGDSEPAYLGGMVLPTAAARERVLGIRDDDAVSADAAGALATACRDRFGSDFSIAVTQYPRFDTTSVMGNAPAAWLAVSDGQGVRSQPINLGGNPAILRSRTARTAMNLLRLRLLPGHG